MKKVLIHIVAWLVFLCHAQSESEYRPFLRNNNNIDLCGNSFQREVLFTLNLGNIVRADSLYGVDFRIIFDTTKIKINSWASLNTLFERFDKRDVFISNNDGAVYGYAAIFANIFGPPVTGNLPFLAFSGEFIGDCFDSAFVKIDYVEFTDEFGKEVTGYDNIYIVGGISDRPERKLSVFPEVNLADLDTNETFAVKYKVSSFAKVDSLLLEFHLSGDSLIIADVSLIANDVIKKLNFDNKSISAELSLNATSEIDLFEVTFKRESTDSLTGVFNPKLIIFDECSCVRFYESIDLALKARKIEIVEDTLSVRSDVFDYFQVVDNQLMLKDNVFNVSQIEIYNLLGESVLSKSENEIQNVIDLNGISERLVFIRLSFRDKKQTLLKYVK